MSDTTARIIAVASRDFVHDVDGFLYWSPTGAGHWPAHALRVIADELDRRNAPWQAQIDAHFSDDPE